MIDIKKIDFGKSGGLVPAVIQDAETYQVLMLGYMNKEALQQTMDKGLVTFYSRSKERLWTKGETSGNTLELVDLQSDCDQDSLIILAKPNGPTCHTGTTSCFSDKEFKAPAGKLDFLNDLEALILDRKKEMLDDSYTTHLFKEGIDEIAQKVGEEAVETIIEAKNTDKEKLIDETSDLVFHLMVLLAEKEVTLNKVVQKLRERHKISTHK